MKKIALGICLFFSVAGVWAQNARVIYQSIKPLNLNEGRWISLETDSVSLKGDWMLECTLFRHGRSEKGQGEVLLSSSDALLYIYKDYKMVNRFGVEEERFGMALVKDPDKETVQELHFPFAAPIGRQTVLKIESRGGVTRLFINGKKVDESASGSLCPVQRLGSNGEGNFRGNLERIKITSLPPSVKK